MITNYIGKFPRKNQDLKMLLIQHIRKYESGAVHIENETNKKKRGNYVTDMSLSTGSYLDALHLNVSLGHLPEKVDSQSAWCSLHRWAKSIKKGKDVIRCQVCKVNLCIPCYSLFHKESNLHDIKHTISDKD
jgi:hypothetical protein